MRFLTETHVEWKTRAFVYGGNPGEKAQAPTGREKSKECLGIHSQQM